jgi:hypothetical protein
MGCVVIRSGVVAVAMLSDMPAVMRMMSPVGIVVIAVPAMTMPVPTPVTVTSVRPNGSGK